METMNSTFDYYPRSLPPFIVGEYSAGNDNKPGGALPPYMTVRAALAEAMFMANFEENADIVEGTSYAPMMMRDLPDNSMPMNVIPTQLAFNSSHMFLAISYHVQRMFRDALLDQTIETRHGHPSIAKAVASISRPVDGILNVSMKLINYGGHAPASDVEVKLDGFGDVLGAIVQVETLSGSANDTNSLAHAQVVEPSLEDKHVTGDSFSVRLPQWSLVKATWRVKENLSCDPLNPNDCRADCAETISARLRECSAAGGGAVKLAAGIYHLRGTSGAFAATLKNLSAVTLTGPAGAGEPTATLMLHGLLGGFQLKNTTAITFARLNIVGPRPALSARH